MRGGVAPKAEAKYPEVHSPVAEDRTCAAPMALGRGARKVPRDDEPVEMSGPRGAGGGSAVGSRRVNGYAGSIALMALTRWMISSVRSNA